MENISYAHMYIFARDMLNFIVQLVLSPKLILDST